MDDEIPDDAADWGLTNRQPTLADLVDLCRELNSRGCKYLIAGGFAVRAAGLSRETGDVDLLMDTSLENEARVFAALATLPDGCVRELDPGDVAKYLVVRVSDEILVDLMASASGIDYAEGSQSVSVRVIDGVEIPFASPELLWRMKRRANRPKDQGDLQFLAAWFAARGRTPPED